MNTALFIGIGLLVFIGSFSGLYTLTQRRLKVRERVGRQGTGEPVDESGWVEIRTRTEQVLKPLGEMIPRSSQEMSKQEARLAKAGIRRKEAVLFFYGVQLSLVILFLVGFAATGYLAQNWLLYPILSVLLGASLPDFWLRQRIRTRKDRIQFALPDALDLLVVTVEAGLGLDQSVNRIGQEIRTTHRDLSEEFQLYNLEVAAGRSRAQGLRNMAARCDVDDMKALTAVLIQTDRFGTSVAQSLRVFSESMRTKRRQRAEERAAKMAVKMITPMVLFVFPSIFIVVAGPAVIAIVREFVPFLAGQK
ncbi:MAG: type II secretion system F family protein [Acidobacteria bacterium]|nr:MAG: type II secretion system F family protein [Acidobacteriota bacterium]